MDIVEQSEIKEEGPFPEKPKKKRKVKPRVKVLVKSSGGPRPGSGRKTGEPQKNVLFQVPIRLDEALKSRVRVLRKDLLSDEQTEIQLKNSKNGASVVFKRSSTKPRITGLDPKKNVMFKVQISIEDIFKVRVREIIAQLVAENPLPGEE